MKFTYTSIDRIFSKFERDLGKDFNEDDIIEWSGEALDLIGAHQINEEAVGFSEVKNYQCDVPKGTQFIRQVARDNRYISTQALSNSICPADIITSIPVSTDIVNPNPSIPVALDCNGTPLNAYDLAYYRPYFDINRDYGIWFGTDYYRDHYSPVRLSNTALYDSLVAQEMSDLNTQDSLGGRILQPNNQSDSYNIILKNKMRFSFQEGYVAIAFSRSMADPETGYPMIPDDISYTTAVVNYVNYMMCKREFYQGRQGADGRMQKAEQDWIWYCGQAGNKAKMPHGEEDYQRLYESRQWKIPLKRYYSYFGNNNSRRAFSANSGGYNNYYNG